MTILPNSAAARDIASLLHPYTNLDRHQTVGPFIAAAGHGVYIEDDSGKRYLEGMSGLWSASLGFSEPRLAAAASRQLQILPFYHTFNHRSHEPAIDLAEKLLSIAPKGLARVLFANSGSEANDAAVKLVWYYNQALGRPPASRDARRSSWSGSQSQPRASMGWGGLRHDGDLSTLV